MTSRSFGVPTSRRAKLGWTVSHCVSTALGKPRSEDVIGFFDNTYWLLDGASIPQHIPQQLKCTTLLYVRELSIQLAQAVLRENSRPLSQILAEAIACVSAQHFSAEQARDIFYPPSSTVILIRITDSELEYLVLGDSYLLCASEGRFECVTDLRLHNIAADIRDELHAASDKSLIEPLARELAKQELSFRNRDDGYWIAAQEPEAAAHAICGTLRFSPGRNSILALSDGLAAAYGTFSLYSSWPDLLNAITDKGILTIIEQIRQVEAADPFAQVYYRSEGSDDASAFLIQVDL